MRVFYLGNFLPDSSTETHIAKTMEKEGIEVVRLQENFTDSNHLAERLRMEDYDLFLFTRTWGETLKNEHLDIIRQRNRPSVSWHLDLYVGLQRDGNIDHDPFWRTSHVFTPDGDPESAKVFENKGINHHYLKPGVFEDECNLFNLNKSKEVIFVGSYNYHPEWTYRQTLIDWLKNRYGNSFEHWGSEGLGAVRGEALNRLYGESKVVIGDSLVLPGHINYWSDRVYETLGRGGFIIHPRIPGLELSFVEDKEIVFYDLGDFKQLAEKIDYYRTHDAEREIIRQAGHQRVLAEHTYRHRLYEVLDTTGLSRDQNKNPETGSV